ncbi:MAG: class I tRNA ligase family protein [Chitinivibrionales bacterium]
MLMITAEGADVYLAKDTFEIGRNFGNKLWNASRFFIENMESSIRFQSLYEADALKPEDIWILSRLQTTVSRVRSAVSNYRFNEMCRVIYDFTWHDFCDWYIEIVKKDLKAAKGERYRVVLNTGSYVLSAILRLLHPVMPFVTEEIWGALRERLLFPGVIDVDSIMDSSYPETDDRYKDTGVEEKMDLLKAVVTSLRTIRSENNVSPGMKGSALVVPDTSEDEEWLSCRRNILQDLANLSELRVDKDAEKPEFAGQGVVKGCRVYLNLEGLIDPEVEANRLNKEIQRLEKLAESTSKRVNNQKFLANAPKDVVDKEKEKEKGICQKLEKLKANLDNLSGNKSKQA